MAKENIRKRKVTKATNKKKKKSEHIYEKKKREDTFLHAIHVQEGDTPITGFEICGPRERGEKKTYR